MDLLSNSAGRLFSTIVTFIFSDSHMSLGSGAKRCFQLRSPVVNWLRCELKDTPVSLTSRLLFWFKYILIIGPGKEKIRIFPN